jgi:hypothetical protein
MIDMTACVSAAVARENTNTARSRIWNDTVRAVDVAVKAAALAGLTKIRVGDLAQAIGEPGMNKELGDYFKKLGFNGVTVQVSGSEGFIGLYW